MTETREQWIEREAREARERYWDGIGDWDSDGYDIRQDWRNVVAPYYQDPVADADTIRDLREIALRAYLAHPHAQDAGCMVDPMEAAVTAVLRAAKLQPSPLRVPVDVEGLAKELALAYHRGVYRDALWAELGADAQEDYIREARAALAYLNIEPCAKPEYNPDDVALTPNERAELENLRVECKRLRHEVEVERDRASDLLADKDSAEAECERLRVKASYATAKAERQRQALDDNRKTIESRGAEIARLENEVKRLRIQQPETRPVKVRFDVTAEDIRVALACTKRGEFVSLEQWYLDYLSDHAVLEVPPGVPSVEKLVKIYEQSSGYPPENKRFPLRAAGVAAIRDAVLDGIQRREWTDADVEELARVMYETSDADGDAWKWDDGSQYAKNTTRKEARAALGWFDGKRG